MFSILVARPGWIATLLFAIACGLRLARFNVLDEDLTRPAWQAEYFVGVPAPAGAVVVLLPVYLMFNGVIEPTRTIALASAVYTVAIAFLLVSRLPIWSGKRLRVPRDKVMPLILGVVFVALLLFTYPWQTLSVAVVAYLAFLPLSARAYSRRAAIERQRSRRTWIGRIAAHRRRCRHARKLQASRSHPEFQAALVARDDRWPFAAS